MKIKLVFSIMVLVTALLLVRCKSCNCGYQPPKAPKVYNQAFRLHK